MCMSLVYIGESCSVGRPSGIMRIKADGRSQRDRVLFNFGLDSGAGGILLDAG